MDDISGSYAEQFGRWMYDVFLSFRGEDTGNSFVDHLYTALVHAGIHSFRDNDTLPTPELLKVIEGSRVSVVVFSKNYANSSRCLEELAKIIECRGDLKGRRVVPVFYYVDPSDVRNQTGTFQEAFERHEVNLKDNMKKVKGWREALRTAANLAGLYVSKIADGREAECITEIVRSISNFSVSGTTKDLVDTESRIGHVKSKTETLSATATATYGVSSSSSLAQTSRWTYNVFLSFRGKDTRNDFVDHLYSALDQAGIHTFKDDEKLRGGKVISPELVKAIEESMVAVVVFSKNYAYSSWCLDELVKIIECRDLMGQMVLPVFYDVKPSDVHGQNRSVYETFLKHGNNLIDDMEKVKRWTEALTTATRLSGWILPANGHETDCIKNIVQRISSYTRSHLAESLIWTKSHTHDAESLLGKGSGDVRMIGMDSRIRELKSLISNRSGDVCIIGIWGISGIGKTTIARAVYRQISYQFEDSCFLEDVRENSSDKRALKSLQEKLLSETLKVKDFKLKHCDDGICQIRRRLGRRRILVVLDDVDNKTQLDLLAGAREWFGPGSRIMLTTRDEQLLSYVQVKYTPELLTEKQAMELFSRYAFKANLPPKVFKEVSDAVVSHTGYLPLALKVSGSHFCGRNIDFWQNALIDLAIRPNEKINGILNMSYDGLNILEKKIFLHIACFYKGWGKLDVTRILDSCGFEAVSGIMVLIQKSLLTILDGRLHMHDLVQEMGRSFVCKCYPNSMVWFQEDIKEVMTTISKLETIEAIVETKDYEDSYNPELFKSMKKLRLLQVYGEFALSKPTHFPENLRWLSWYAYPFQSLQITRGMTKLGGLELTSSSIQQLQIENKVILSNLKFMNLCESWALTSFPDISGVPNLEELNLSFCESLAEVHQSVLLHKRIRSLSLSSCKSLKILPPNIEMESLQSLTLAGCESLETFPEVTMEMGRLLLLDMYGCKKIKALPSSIRLFTGLIIFTIGNDSFSRSGYIMSMPLNKQRMPDFAYFPSLRILDLANNDLVDNDFPIDVHNAWPSLEELDLSDNLFTRLPACISQLSLLKYLDLRNCFNLIELNELPSFIQVLKADNCVSLEKIGDLSNKYDWLFQISLHSCPELLEDQESVSHVANFLSKSLIQNCAAVNHRLSITVPGCEIPNWFSNQMFGNTITLNIPQKQITDIIGLAVCCLFSRLLLTIPIRLTITFKGSGVKNLIDMPTTLAAAKTSECVWIGYLPMDFLLNKYHGFENIIISFKPDFTDRNRSSAGGIVKCGVCVVYKDDIKSMTGIGSWIPDYDELKSIKSHCDCIEKLQRGRWSSTSFSTDDEKTGDDNTVKVLI